MIGKRLGLDPTEVRRPENVNSAETDVTGESGLKGSHRIRRTFRIEDKKKTKGSLSRLTEEDVKDVINIVSSRT